MVSAEGSRKRQRVTALQVGTLKYGRGRFEKKIVERVCLRPEVRFLPSLASVDEETDKTRLFTVFSVSPSTTCSHRDISCTFEELPASLEHQEPYPDASLGTSAQRILTRQLSKPAHFNWLALPIVCCLMVCSARL